MNYDEIMCLARAGYTKDEINAMAAGATTPAAAPEPKPASTAPEPATPPAPAVPTPAPVTPAVPTPAPVTPAQQAPQSVEEQLLRQILGAVQATNRAGITGQTAPAEQSGMDAVRAASASIMGIPMGGDK